MDQGDFAVRLDSLRETRARLPELVRNRHATRRRRSVVGHSGRLLLLEADDAARGVAFDSPRADRGVLLERLAGALELPGVDGVVGTPDLIDDLLLLERLDDRLAMGSMNSGGLVGSAFELDDRITAYDAESVAASHLDGGKVRLRIDPGDPGTAGTLEAAGRAVSGLSLQATLCLLELGWCRHESGAVVEDRSVEALSRAVGIASALGARSAYTWLVVPYVPGLEAILGSTTLPALVRLEGLGTETSIDECREVLQVRGVRGFVLPQRVLFPTVGEPLGPVEEVATLLRETADLDRKPERGRR